MTTKAESLRLIVGTLLRRFRDTQLERIPSTCPREADPLWQVGHAAFDACRALVTPFTTDISMKFGDVFHGSRSLQPWDGQPPELPAILTWWGEILGQAEDVLATHNPEEPLREPIAFTAYTVHSIGEAYDYVVYHTSFHVGLAQGLLSRADA